MADFVAGFFAPWIIYALILGMHLALAGAEGRWICPR